MYSICIKMVIKVLKNKPATAPLQPAGEPWGPLHGRCFPPVGGVQSCVVLRGCGPAPAAGLGTDISPLAPQHESAFQSAPIAPLATVLSVCMAGTAWWNHARAAGVITKIFTVYENYYRQLLPILWCPWLSSILFLSKKYDSLWNGRNLIL